MNKNSETGYAFSTKVLEPCESEGILGAPPRQLLVKYNITFYSNEFEYKITKETDDSIQGVAEGGHVFHGSSVAQRSQMQ